MSTKKSFEDIAKAGYCEYLMVKHKLNPDVSENSEKMALNIEGAIMEALKLGIQMGRNGFEY